MHRAHSYYYSASCLSNRQTYDRHPLKYYQLPVGKCRFAFSKKSRSTFREDLFNSEFYDRFRSVPISDRFSTGRAAISVKYGWKRKILSYGIKTKLEFGQISY